MNIRTHHDWSLAVIIQLDFFPGWCNGCQLFHTSNDVLYDALEIRRQIISVQSYFCLTNEAMIISIIYIAVKILDWAEDGMVTSAEAAAIRASFRQEVAVWQKLDHPNVTKVIISFCLPIIIQMS